MSDLSIYIKQIITSLFPERQNLDVAGGNKNLREWISWYNGFNKFHCRKAIVNSETTTVKIRHSDFGKLVCNTMASQFLNEDTSVVLPNEAQDKLLQTIFLENRFKTRINGFGEKYFALGLGATVVMPSNIMADKDTKVLIKNTKNKVKISMIDATRVIPITIDDGEIIECAFVKYSTNNVTLQVHLLDSNGNYIISEVSGANTNKSFSLDFKTQKVWQTNSNVPLFQIWNPAGVDNKDLENDTGVSILANIIEWIKAFDEAFDKFYIEYKNGAKKRYISSELEFIDPETGQTKYVPRSEEDIVLPPSKMPNAPNMIQDQVSEIRADQFIRGMQFFANMISKGAGLGDGKFNIDGNTGRPLTTATAEIMKNNEAFRNIHRNEMLAEINLKNLCLAIQFVYNETIENKFNFNIDDVNVTFEDNIIEDTTARKELDMKMVSAGLKTIAEYRAEWCEESEEEAEKYIHDNALLLEKYQTALQAKAITPEKFVDLVYGPNVEKRNELIKYITDGLATPTAESFKEEADV